MSDQPTGLVIADDHQATLERLEEAPLSFRVTDTSNLPREWMSDIPARSQGRFSSCVGGGLSGCAEHRNLVETGVFLRMSMWQCYISAQKACGMSGRDGGATLAGAMKAAGSVGIALNELCPMPQSYTTNIPSDAIADAGLHRHLGDVHYDCRQWDRMLDWVTNKDPVLFGGIWTSNHGEMNSKNWIEKPNTLGGNRRGMHCRYLCGWTTIDGQLAPLIRNTHGPGFGRNGIVAISREAWNVYLRDPNTVCLAFGDLQEREPKRRSYVESKVGDSC